MHRIYGPENPAFFISGTNPAGHRILKIAGYPAKFKD
jgi:hypothetical protein